MLPISGTLWASLDFSLSPSPHSQQKQHSGMKRASQACIEWCRDSTSTIMQKSLSRGAQLGWGDPSAQEEDPWVCCQGLSRIRVSSLRAASEPASLTKFEQEALQSMA